MGKVILDAAMRAELNGLTEPLELYDEQGNLLGHLEPVSRPTPDYTAAGGWGPFTAEEVREAMSQTGPGRPLADILADLRRQYP